MCAYVASNKELNFLNPESQRIFREMLENIKMGAFMADAHSKIFYINHAFSDTFNVPNREHVLGKNWLEFLIPDGQLRTACLACLDKTGFVNDFEVSHIIYGFKVTLLISANHIRNDQGHVIGVRGVFVNISERLKLEEKIRLEHQKLEEILSFYQSLEHISQVDELAKYIVHQTARILKSKRCSLMFIDNSSNEIYLRESFGLPDEYKDQARIRIGDPVAGVIVLKSQPMLIEDIESHEFFKRQKRKSYAGRSFMSAPLVYDHKLIGILNVCEQEQAFSALDLKVLETIAQQAAVSFEKLSMLNKYQYMAQTDAMTGLLNFRSFTQKLIEETDRANRYNLPLSLIMVDVDHFKAYNDTFGHPAGSKLLKNLAEMFRANLRTTESICRYGGDEFGIILPNTDAGQAVLTAEKLRELIIKKFAQEKITLSIGVAQLEGKIPIDTFIKQADGALYQSKQAGKNCVSLFNPSITS